MTRGKNTDDNGRYSIQSMELRFLKGPDRKALLTITYNCGRMAELYIKTRFARVLRVLFGAQADDEDEPSLRVRRWRSREEIIEGIREQTGAPIEPASVVSYTSRALRDIRRAVEDVLSEEHALADVIERERGLGYRIPVHIEVRVSGLS